MVLWRISKTDLGLSWMFLEIFPLKEWSLPESFRKSMEAQAALGY